MYVFSQKSKNEWNKIIQNKYLKKVKIYQNNE